MDGSDDCDCSTSIFVSSYPEARGVCEAVNVLEPKSGKQFELRKEKATQA